MEQTGLFTRVATVIATKLNIEVARITPATKIPDLGADSLDTMEVLMALEDEFHLKLPETIADATMGELVEAISVRMASGTPAPSAD